MRLTEVEHTTGSMAAAKPTVWAKVPEGRLFFCAFCPGGTFQDRSPQPKGGSAMPQYRIVPLRQHPDLAGPAAEWFAAKWGIPIAEYRASIDASLQAPDRVPQWYLALDGGCIAAGAGLIENDFHGPARPGPQPVCAVCAAVPPGPGAGPAAAGSHPQRRCADGRGPAVSGHRPHRFLRAVRLAVFDHRP